MSTNETEAYVRFVIGEYEDHDEALRVAKSKMGCEPQFEDEISFEESEEGFIVNYVENKLCIDYVFFTEWDSFSVDITIPLSELIVIKNKFFNKFQLDIEPTVRVLQYYNGGCAGLAEVL